MFLPYCITVIIFVIVLRYTKCISTFIESIIFCFLFNKDFYRICLVSADQQSVIGVISIGSVLVSVSELVLDIYSFPLYFQLVR